MTARTAEVDSLRTQLSSLRQQLERESLAYGELRAQAARHETIARQALMRAEDAETRARDLLRDLGDARMKCSFTQGEIRIERKAERVFQPSRLIGEADCAAIVYQPANLEPLRQEVGIQPNFE